MSLSAKELQLAQEFENQLAIFNGSFPDEAVAYAVNNKETSIPVLLRFIQEAIENVKTLSEDFFGHLYALFILSELKEKKAYPLALEICKLSYDRQEDLLGDSLTENLAQFIGSTFDGDLASLKKLIESPSTHYYARGECLCALFVLLNDGIINTKDIHSYLPHLFDLFIKNKDQDGMTNLVCFCLDFEVLPYLENIKQAFKLGLVDVEMVNLKDVLYTVENKEHHNYKTIPHYQSVKDASKEMSWWACFQEEKKEKDSEMFFEQQHQHSDECGCNSKTYMHTFPKIGRNDPCYCGSGKKYKKCCLN